MKRAIIVGLIVGASALAYSYFFYEGNIVQSQGRSSSNTKLSKTKNVLEKNIKIVGLPTGYTLQKTTEHTHFIGTTDQPTINGGIINTYDGVPVNHTVPDKNKVVIVPKAPPPSVKQHKSFEDDWAKNNKVKKLLTEAAREGKLEYVLKKADKMGLPASVAVVPMVESHYQTHAVSPKGAAGAWQLMPSVAKDYGIHDKERFHFSTSTDTALQLLNALHQKFKNWDLAFAAYNSGSKRIMDALQKNPAATSIDELDLPTETKNYVHKIKEINEILGKIRV